MDDNKYLAILKDKDFPLDWENFLIFIWQHFARPVNYESETEEKLYGEKK